MPVTLTYPGVYIEEIQSNVHPITGVATSIAAFVGRAAMGQENEPLTIHSYGEFELNFGGLTDGMTMGFAVRDFFLNGGAQAIILRLSTGGPAQALQQVQGAPQAQPEAQPQGAASAATAPAAGGNATAPASAPAASGNASAPASASAAGGNTAASANPSAGTAAAPAATGASPAKISLPSADASKPLVLWAASSGAWGNLLKATVDYKTSPVADAAKRALFNLTVSYSPPTGRPTQESFLNLSTDPADPRYATTVLADQSQLVEIDPALTGSLPLPKVVQGAKAGNDTQGVDGGDLTDNDLIGDGLQGEKLGLYALSKTDIFNMLCIPPLTAGGTLSTNLVSTAATFCESRRAMMIVDPPDSWTTKSKALNDASDLSANVGTTSANAAIFFPRLNMPNPLKNNRIEPFVPCGAVAGIFARTDGDRGVWKAPAGVNANFTNVPQLSVTLDDGDNGDLNPLGVNCLRAFPVIGRVIWGSRTMRGADLFADDYKYVPVRRFTLFLEESLYRGTQWVVFEPNADPLWRSIRLNVGAFMHNLFVQGAFQGTTPNDAYFVKCDNETTTQNDIDLGIVNIVVGFAPLKPAEFVVIQIQQMTGDILT